MNWRQNRYERENIQRRVAAHVRDEKKSKNIDFKKMVDDKLRYQGKMFFESGLFLDDAPEELKNNDAFIDGYEGARIRKQEVYDIGFQSFIDGVAFENIPKIYQNNIDFIQGYNDAKSQSLIDGFNLDNNCLEDENIISKGRHR